jgi:prepilin-type N-terminal cleavage/methylation domain-containing protein
MVKGAEVACMKRGFTLVELLLVVTILGILAAIAVPKLFPQTEKARVAEAIAILQSIRQGEAAYFLEHNEYLGCPDRADCWSNLGMEDPNSNNARFFDYSIDVDAVPVRFDAVRRRGVSDPDRRYGRTIITLDSNGTYGGNHPFRPS